MRHFLKPGCKVRIKPHPYDIHSGDIGTIVSTHISFITQKPGYKVNFNPFLPSICLFYTYDEITVEHEP